MSERCLIQGRQQAIQPLKGFDDDGAIAYADLAARGANRIDLDDAQPTSGTSTEAGGYAVSPPESYDHLGSSTENQQRYALTMSLDEDPFGHNHLGFDDSGDAAHVEAASLHVADDCPSVMGNPQGDLAANAVVDTGSDPIAQLVGQQRQIAHASHSLRRSGHVVWCFRCGRHAAVRLGIGLLQECRGFADGAYPARIRRLIDRRHPVTGVYL